MTCDECGADDNGARQCNGLDRTLRLFKYIGLNKRIFDQIMAEWESRKQSGG